MNCAEAYVKFMCDWLLDKCLDDMEFMAKNYDKTCLDRLRMVASTPFVRISYTEAVELLKEAVREGKKFENDVEWGIDLASEHERLASYCIICIVCGSLGINVLVLIHCRYLTEVKFQKPVIVYNYPKGIKAFYMRLNDDSKTVAAMDVLVPKVFLPCSYFTIFYLAPVLRNMRFKMLNTYYMPCHCKNILILYVTYTGMLAAYLLY